MKQAISLIEVIISVFLIVVVIGIVLKMQQSSLFFLDKYSSSNKMNAHVSIVALNKVDTPNRSKNVYLDSVIDFNDDDIRKELKKVKIKIKDDKEESIKKEFEDFTLKIDVFKSNYIIEEKLEKKLEKNFYTVKFE